MQWLPWLAPPALRNTDIKRRNAWIIEAKLERRRRRKKKPASRATLRIGELNRLFLTRYRGDLLPDDITRELRSIELEREPRPHLFRPLANVLALRIVFFPHTSVLAQRTERHSGERAASVIDRLALGGERWLPAVDRGSRTAPSQNGSEGEQYRAFHGPHCLTSGPDREEARFPLS
jgi:hypothetical protein